MESNTTSIRHDRAGLILCPACNKSQGEFEKIDFNYYCGRHQVCRSCKEPIDWWDAISRTIKQKNWLSEILAPIGARLLVLQTFLKPNKELYINLNDYGIPSDAKILDINYSPQVDREDQNCLFPIEIHGNTPKRTADIHHLRLYPRPIEESKLPGETRLIIAITWVPKTEDDEMWSYLFCAFEAFSRNHFRDCVLPANVAVESKLLRLLTKYLLQFCGKDRVDDFLENGATYSYQLNILLQVAAKNLGLPVLPDHIRGLLNRLRVLRNEVAHSGQPERVLTKEDCADIITAAYFGFHYLNLFDITLNDNLTKGSCQGKRLDGDRE